MYKKGFTLIELILVLIAISALSVYAIKSYNQSQLNSSIIELQDTLVEIIDNALLSENGYLRGNVGEISADTNCSTFTDEGFSNLTTERLFNCMQWNEEGRYSKFNYDVVTDTISGIGLMDKYNGCRIQVKGIENNRDEFDIYISCEDVSTENSRELHWIEDTTIHTLQRTFAGHTRNINANGRSINDANSANNETPTIDESDGRIAARIGL